MQFDVPDPRYTHSAHSRAVLGLAIRLALGFVALLWLVHLINWALDLDPHPFGLRPREAVGLVGIVTAPLVHGDFARLVSSSCLCEPQRSRPALRAPRRRLNLHDMAPASRKGRPDEPTESCNEERADAS